MKPDRFSMWLFAAIDNLTTHLNFLTMEQQFEQMLHNVLLAKKTKKGISRPSMRFLG
jgi:hypothetical protein